jgi:hypothetical protein
VKRLVLALAFALLVTSAGASEVLRVDQYRARLVTLSSAISGRQLVAAKTIAQRLLEARVAWNGEELATDRSILQPITVTRKPEELAAFKAPVESLIHALEQSIPDNSTAADLARLERVAAAEKYEGLQRGGSVASVPQGEQSVMERAAEVISDVWNWIVDKLERFFDWLSDFWPKRSKRETGSIFGVPNIIAILVACIVLLLLYLVIHTWRKKRSPAAAPVQPDVKSIRRDEDPLSREANEWERYAEELAAAGRVREAIRAWYHAVLVALYRAGALHYRKGRTNWEYVAALGPHIPWRARFIEMTRTFEREWYGRDRSNVEALERCATNARAILDSAGRSAA